MQNNEREKEDALHSVAEHSHTKAHALFFLHSPPALISPRIPSSRLREIFIPKQKEQKKYLCSSVSKMFQPTRERQEERNSH